MLISGIVAIVSILDHAEMDVRLFRRVVVMKRTIDIKRGLLMSCIFVISFTLLFQVDINSALAFEQLCYAQVSL